VELADLAVKHVPVQEEERAERLGLRAGADVLRDGEVGDEGVDSGSAMSAGWRSPWKRTYRRTHRQ
jgi:hypothetical protein